MRFYVVQCPTDPPKLKIKMIRILMCWREVWEMAVDTMQVIGHNMHVQVNNTCIPTKAVLLILSSYPYEEKKT